MRQQLLHLRLKLQKKKRNNLFLKLHETRACAGFFSF
jgi:hypothetical protein